MFKNVVKEKFNDLEKFVEDAVDRFTDTIEFDNKQLKLFRSEFNILAINASIGTDFYRADGKWHLKSNWSALPNSEEIDLVKTCADSFIVAFNEKLMSGNDDMDLVKPEPNVIIPEKLTNKTFIEMLQLAVVTQLSSEDIVNIYMAAKQLRKHNKKVLAAKVVGGIAVAAAAVGGYKLYEMKQAAAEHDDDDEGDDNTYDTVGSDVIVSADDDAPVVIIDDGSVIKLSY